MKRWSTTFLQVITVFVGIGVMALLVWEPHIEGRNAHATLTEIYVHDPFLVYVSVGSIPFFVALYEGFRLLGWVRSPQDLFSDRAIRAVRVIRTCAKVTIGLIFVGVVILMFTGDERPPAAFMGLLVTLAFLVIGASAAAFERLLQSGVDLKSENDLTV
jgi:hypothetical protein